MVAEEETQGIVTGRNIYILTSSLANGGAEKIFSWLVRSLETHGHSVQVFSLSGDEAQAHFRNPVIFLPWHGFLSYPRVILAFRKWILKGQPDVVIGWSFFSNLVAVLAARFSGMKCRLICNERSQVSELLKESSFFKRALLSAMTKYCYSRASAVICNSKSACNDLINNFGIRFSDVFSVDNPVDIEFVNKHCDPIPEEYMNAIHPIYAYVGRLSKEKGLDDLLFVFAKLTPAERGSLFLIGDGPERKNIERLVETLGLRSRVIFLGRREYPYAFMKHADALVIPSSYEGFPNVLLEGMAAGAAIVSTASCDRVEDVGRRGGCLVCPVHDRGQLAMQIRSVLDVNVNHRSRESAVIIANEYSCDKIYCQYVDKMFPAELHCKSETT